MKKYILPLVLIFAWLSVAASAQARASASPAAPGSMGPAFTYQGQLKDDAGNPITASCAFEFTLWDGSGGGIQIGNPSTAASVSVIDGYFTALVNAGGEFGSVAFMGEERWLEVSVQCSGDPAYTTLSPRQALTPAPVAFSLPGLYTLPNLTSPNIIGGYIGNGVPGGTFGATISGGGYNGFPNHVTSHYGTVGGGNDNTADYVATVGGGAGNQAGQLATVGGGYYNAAAGYRSTVGGGYQNTASGMSATVPGGEANTASGSYSFAAGHQAKAVHNGAFVWADSTPADFASTAADQFIIRAGGGVGIGVNNPQAQLHMNASGMNTAVFESSSGPNASNIHYGPTGDWYIRSAASTGNVILQDTGGSVGIGTTAVAASGLTVNGQVIAGGTASGATGGEPFNSRGASSGLSMDDRTLGAGYRWVIFPDNSRLDFWNGSTKAALTADGVLALAALGNAGTTEVCWNGLQELAYCSSSKRYKTNISSLSLGLEAVAQLRPVTFDWMANGEADLGFVAEEVAEVSPLLVTRNINGQVEGVKYERLSAVLVNGMQEQQQQIAALEQRIAALEQGKPAAAGDGSPVAVSTLAVIAVLLAVVVLQSILLWRLAAFRLGRRPV